MITRICVREECSSDFTVKIPSDKKKYCSRSCAATVNNKSHPKRTVEGVCKMCESPIPNSRTYCDDHMSKQFSLHAIIDGIRYTPEEALELWKDGSWVGGSERKLSAVVRRYILSKFNYSCSVCGFDEKHPTDGGHIVEIDHINGVGSDHREVNLTVLCPNHHTMTPTFRGRNRGNGRNVFYHRIVRNND